MTHMLTYLFKHPTRAFSSIVKRRLLTASLLGFISPLTLASTTIGVNAGDNLTHSGEKNTLIGENSGALLVSGDNNTLIGYNAGSANIDDSDNTFIGASTGELGTETTFDNTFIGARAGQKNNGTGANYSSLGNDNTFIGTDAGKENTTGVNNTFIGEESGENNTTGKDNTFIGENSGISNTTATDNTAIGNNALLENETGNYNTAVGNSSAYYLGYSDRYGVSTRNTVIGQSAGYKLYSAVANTMIGDASGRYTTYGHFNTFLGIASGYYNGVTIQGEDHGHRNTAIGSYAGYSNRKGNDNVWIGALSDTGKFNFDHDNTANYITTSASNAPGYDYNVTNISNSSDNVSRSTVVGNNASAFRNDSIVVGYKARNDNIYTLALGNNSSANEEGAIAIGDSNALDQKNAISIGRGNTIGRNTLESTSIGYGAIAFHDYAITLGNTHTLNWQANTPSTTALGNAGECDWGSTLHYGDYYYAKPWECTALYRFKDVYTQAMTAFASDSESAKIHFNHNNGYEYLDRWFIQAADSGDLSFNAFSIGNRGTWTVNEVVPLSVSHQGEFTSAGGLTLHSDERLKKDIRPIQNAVVTLQQLSGVTYHWKNNLGRTPKRQYGVIAQEINTVLPELVHQADDEMQTKSVNYQALIPVLITAINEQQQTLKNIEAQLTSGAEQ